MINNENIFHSKIVKLFPFLNERQFPEIDIFKNTAIYSKIPQGKLITLEGDSCGYLSFVVSGIVRVYKTGETGREITLYRLYEGDSCILTASCIVSNSTFPAFSVAETDIEVLSIPSNLFSSWIKKYDVWQKFIFNLITERLTDIISVVEEIAFRHIDVRIADRLSKLYDDYGNTIKITHHELASDIGSSREVVSRVLKDFEEKQIVSISRGSIEITNIDFLKDYSKKI